SKISECSNCQRYEHFAISCFRDSKCAFCARDHKTSEYKCETCSKRDEICQHTLLKCSNCKEKHASSLKE
ncbi:hypothetical protein BDDG_13846, partial [Blastomyces dermatitidis ATCC 18188]